MRLLMTLATVLVPSLASAQLMCLSAEALPSWQESSAATEVFEGLQADGGLLEIFVDPNGYWYGWTSYADGRSLTCMWTFGLDVPTTFEVPAITTKEN